MDEDDRPIWVAVPERLDRRLRLGPFPSGRDAVKFVAAAAVAAVVSLVVAPWAGLPIVAVGALVALWRPDGEALDDRLAAVARWALRRVGGPGTMSGPGDGGPSGAPATVRLGDGRIAAIVQLGGVPLAFLPPDELARQFELYRQLLRAVDGDLLLVATAAPIHAGAVVPRDGAVAPGEEAARAGYRELVELLARRRSVRRVYLALAQGSATPEGRRRLEGAVDRLGERLADLGLRAERLRGTALRRTARRLRLSPLEGDR